MKYWIAEVLDSFANFLCTLTGHFNGCWVSSSWINTRVGTWVYETLSADRYPEYRGSCDGCALCGRKYKQTVPNPYYSSESELAEWARWYGSDVSPDDYAEWRTQRAFDGADDRVTTGSNGVGKTYAWTFCPNCKTGSMQTFDSNITR